MKKLKLYISTIAIAAMTAFCFNTINTVNSYAFSNTYMTVDYECAEGGTVDRCDYGNSGCDIGGQELCPGEGVEEN